METRPIARAGREVSAIGVGTRGLHTRRDPTDARRALALALDLGCTLVDVAPAWHGSQGLVGELVRELRLRDRVVVTSLIEPLTPPPRPVAAGALIIPRSAAALASVLPPPYVQRTVEDSLRALRLEALPLALVGGWRDGWLDDRAWPELRGTLDRLVREGKVLAWGVAARDDGAGDAVRVCAEPWLAAVQVRRSLVDRSADEALAPAAAAAGVAVIAREPLAGGVLAGQLGPGVRFPSGDERNRWPAERVAAIVPDLARLAGFVTHTPPAAGATDAGRAVLDGLRRGDDVEIPTVAELALRYAIDPPAITAAVVGVRTAEHVLADLPVADYRRLPAGLRAALDDRRWGETWYA